MSLLLPGVSRSQDTLICDNGGFEDDFDYYFGDTSIYTFGGNTCETLNNSRLPVPFGNISIPVSKRFEIAGTGVDPLVGINKVKFGSKSALINNKNGHFGFCAGTKDVNKLRKRFKVTEDNLDITVWFAVVFENPTGHNDQQAFFSIKCDRAPAYDLCFDASILTCAQEYNDSICDFDPIDVLDWSCHRIKIPREMIDSIATLELTVADCGRGDHVGYAYIDGICEDCTGGSMGSISLNLNHEDTLGNPMDQRTCDGDTLTLCGSYTLPDACGIWALDSIVINGFTIYDLDVDTNNHTYCFKITIDDFPDENCRDLVASAYFSYLTKRLPPKFSNSLVICPDDFETYNNSITVSDCYDNNTPNFISDDYYYVYLNLDNFKGDTWTVYRELSDPYPNESGIHVVRTDTGDGNFILGPFLIQEGSWDLRIVVKHCEYTHTITPPNFCGVCQNSNRINIFDVACHDPSTPNDPSDDTWSFKFVAYRQGGGTYKLYKTTPGNNFYYNTVYTITEGLLINGCINYKVRDESGPCEIQVMICPPKPCSSYSAGDLEVYVEKYQCEEDDDFRVLLNVSGIGSNYLCHQITYVTSNTSSTGSLPSGFLGPFSEDIIIKVFFCSSSNCNCTPDCYKYIYIPALECEDWEDFGLPLERNSIVGLPSKLIVVPNPSQQNEVLFNSNLPLTEFEWYNSSGQSLLKGKFEGKEHKISINLVPGLYFIKYRDFDGVYRSTKFIKL